MNRIIKFRGLRVDGKGWVYGSLIVKCEQYFIVHLIKIKDRKFSRIREEYREVEVIPETVGQFTGRIDKNGKDIYEDDNIKFKDKIYRIVYRDGSFFAISDSETHWIFCLHALDTIDIEVTGNIH